MTIEQLTELLMKQTGVTRETTCDGILCGSGAKEANTVATCFKASVDVIRKAKELGVDLLICHEPLFYGEETRETTDPIALQKWKLLDESGITVFRYHDYAHEMTPDYIHKGFLDALGLEVEEMSKYGRTQLGVRKYDLKTPLPMEELISRIKEKLHLPTVKVAGATDQTVKSLILALGGTFQARHFSLLETLDADVFVTGEAGEVLGYEYIRDTVAFGEKKSVLILGHYGSEFAGMEYLAKDLTKRGIPAFYIDCGEVFAAY